MEKMEKFINSVKRISAKSKHHADPEFSFAVLWGYHLIDVMKNNRNDDMFIAQLAMNASEYFRNNLTEQQKVDVFCLLLGQVTASGRGKRS